MLDQLLPVVFLCLVVIVFGAGMIFLTSLTGIRAEKTAIKLMPYESGIPGQDPGTTKVPVKFYLTAISFILFDIEIIFLYPWVLLYMKQVQTNGLYLLGGMGIFTLILIYGLIYEFKSGALEWD